MDSLSFRSIGLYSLFYPLTAAPPGLLSLFSSESLSLSEDSSFTASLKVYYYFDNDLLLF